MSEFQRKGDKGVITDTLSGLGRALRQVCVSASMCVRTVTFKRNDL